MGLLRAWPLLHIVSLPTIEQDRVVAVPRECALARKSPLRLNFVYGSAAFSRDTIELCRVGQAGVVVLRRSSGFADFVFLGLTAHFPTDLSHGRLGLG